MHVKTMVVFQGASALPEDRFVNTFHFNHAASTLPLAMGDIGPALSAFYNTITGAISIGQQMSTWVSRLVQIRAYDMGTAEPRVPLLSTFFTTDGVAGTQLPDEVAICASFHGAPPVTPSRRGRVFLGPFMATVVTTSTTAGPKVSDNMRNLISQRCTDLANSAAGWSVFSPTNGTLTEVTGGFTDNAFDTMRKRGAATTGRTPWVAS